MSGKIKTNYSFIFLLVAFFIAFFISIKVGMKSEFRLDNWGAEVFSHVPDSSTPFFIQVSELGDKLWIGIVALVMLVWLLLKKRNYAGAATLALSIGTANELYKLLKDLFARPRPDLEYLIQVKSYSYPSGHALVGLVVYFIIAYLLIESIHSKAGKILIGILAAFLLLLIGASRVILHVHYLSDVIGGYAMGYIWVSMWIYFYKYIMRRFH